MIQKLREALANTTKAEFQREWAEIQAMGLKGPTVSELLAYQKKQDFSNVSNAKQNRTFCKRKARWLGCLGK